MENEEKPFRNEGYVISTFKNRQHASVSYILQCMDLSKQQTVDSLIICRAV